MALVTHDFNCLVSQAALENGICFSFRKVSKKLFAGLLQMLPKLEHNQVRSDPREFYEIPDVNGWSKVSYSLKENTF